MKRDPHPYHSTAERRRSIAQAACEVVVEKGFEGLRTRDVAQRVGVTIATLHYHVATKNDLVELMASSLSARFSELHLRNSASKSSPAERLLTEFRDYREILVKEPLVMAAMGELSRRARRDPLVAQHVDPINERWRSQIAEFIAAGMAEGSFRSDLDLPAATHMIVAALVALPVHAPPDPDFHENLANQVLRLFASDACRA